MEVGAFFFVAVGICRSIIARHLSIFRPSLKRFELLDVWSSLACSSTRRAWS